MDSPSFYGAEGDLKPPAVVGPPILTKKRTHEQTSTTVSPPAQRTTKHQVTSKLLGDLNHIPKKHIVHPQTATKVVLCRHRDFTITRDFNFYRVMSCDGHVTLTADQACPDARLRALRKMDILTISETDASVLLSRQCAAAFLFTSLPILDKMKIDFTVDRIWKEELDAFFSVRPGSQVIVRPMEAGSRSGTTYTGQLQVLIHI
jgi:hypothetical protein